MARRGNWGAELLDGFSQGMSLAERVKKTREDQSIKEELAALAQQQAIEQPAVVDTTVPQDMASASGSVSEARATAAPQQVVRQPARYSLAGTTQDQPFSPEQAGVARTLAQAGIMDKYGRIEEAARLRAQAQQSQLATLSINDAKERSKRAATEFDWQKADRERMAAAQAREDEWRTGRQDAFASTSFAAKDKAYSGAMEQYQQAKAAYQQAVDNGDTSAVPPSEPQRPQSTIGETLRDHATILAHDVRFGKASTEDLLKYQQLRKNVEDEGYTKLLQALQSGAPSAAAIARFNAQAEQKIDPATVASAKEVTRPDGTKTVVMSFNNGAPPIDTAAELTAMGKGDELLNRAMKLHTMANQDRAAATAEGHLAVSQQEAGRRAQEFAGGATKRAADSAEAELRIRLANTEDPNEQAQLSGKIAALRSGSRGQGNTDTAEMKLARFAVETGKFAGPSAMADALDWAHSKKDASPDAVYQEMLVGSAKNGMLSQSAIEIADKAMAAMGAVRNGDRWVKKGSGAASGAPISFGSEADAMAAVKSGKLKDGDKVKINGRTAVWRDPTAPAPKAAPPAASGASVAAQGISAQRAANQVQPARQAQMDAEAGKLMIRNEFGGDVERARAELAQMREGIARAPKGEARTMLEAQANRLAAGIAAWAIVAQR